MGQPIIYLESRFEAVTRRLGLFVIAPLLLALTLPVVVDIARKPDYGITVHRMVIVAVAPHGPASRTALAPGDRLVTFNGRPTGRMHEYYAAKAGNVELAPVRVGVRTAAGDSREVVITPVRPAQSDLIHGYSVWVAGLSFLFIGWWVLRHRPDPVARNFFVLCLIFAFFLLDIPDHRSPAYMLAKDTLRTCLQLLLPAFFLRFFLLFPSHRLRHAGHPVFYRLLPLTAWTLFLLIIGLDAVDLMGPGSLLEKGLEVVSTLFALGCFVAGLVIFGRRVLRRERPIQQTKLRVVLYGLVCGLVPFLSATLVANVLPGSPLPHWQYLGLSLLLVPFSFGLAILRYGALDTGFVVRISLIYGLLTVLVLCGYFLIVGLVGNVLAGIFAVDTWPVMLLTAAASGLGIMPLRGVVQEWIDRSFYPARRTDRRAINQLAEGLSGLIDPDEVVQTLHDKLTALYRPRGLAIFLPTQTPEPGFQTSGYRAAAAPPVPAPAPADFLPARSDLAHLLNRLRRPLFREEIEDHIFAGDAEPDTLRLLTRLDAALVVPLITGNRLLGFLVFGPKQGGALFSQDDLANLRALAVQAASLFESRQLYAAGLDQRRLETELEVARDLQANLLPSDTLSTDDFLIRGHNEPCRMVGGDYFDYFVLANGDLCFAIADVSGKGIPAALLMTSVRVAFRQEARPGMGPATLVGRLNEVVLALGSEGFFTCFFCGIWNPGTGLLRYCNAGLEPPVLFRPGSRYRQALRKGGPVLGVTTTAHYREGAIGLAPGDRLFMYTDGLTEEQDADGQFFDAPRLLDLVAGHIDGPPDALLGQVFAAVEAFGGDDRTDDRTAIILEIKQLQN